MSQQKTLLVLGGGRHQINLIKYAEKHDVTVVLSDYLESSPGHKVATHSYLSSTLDVEKNIEHAKKHQIDGVITTGTDQPLVTMAEVAEAMGIDAYLTPVTARMCTNKREMFKCLKSVNIPEYQLIDNIEQTPIDFDKINFPIIIKPLDSQGQRGISIIHNERELNRAYQRAKKHSNDTAAVVQEYITGPEMTISAWMHNGQLQILLITDRVTYNKSEAVGVCLQHIYPSKHLVGLEEEAYKMAEKIAEAYQLKNGPLYIQFLRNNDKLYLVEATCRIGGGHEDRLTRHVTGVNIYPHLMYLGLEGSAKHFDFNQSFPIKGKHVLVNFILAKKGTLAHQHFDKEALQKIGLIEGGFYYEDGYKQPEIINSLGRIGYFIAQGDTKAELMSNSKKIYEQFYAENEVGENLVFWPNASVLND